MSLYWEIYSKAKCRGINNNTNTSNKLLLLRFQGSTTTSYSNIQSDELLYGYKTIVYCFGKRDNWLSTTIGCLRDRLVVVIGPIFSNLWLGSTHILFGQWPETLPPTELYASSHVQLTRCVYTITKTQSAGTDWLSFTGDRQRCTEYMHPPWQWGPKRSLLVLVTPYVLGQSHEPGTGGERVVVLLPAHAYSYASHVWMQGDHWQGLRSFTKPIDNRKHNT